MPKKSDCECILYQSSRRGGGGGQGVLLGILGGGVLPGSPNRDLISDQKL